LYIALAWQTVPSFLTFPTAGPLLSSKSVASFFKKPAGISSKPSEKSNSRTFEVDQSRAVPLGSRTLRPWIFDVQTRLPPAADTNPFCPQLPRSFRVSDPDAALCFQQHRGFASSERVLPHQTRRARVKAKAEGGTVEGSTSKKSKEQALEPGLLNLRHSTFNCFSVASFLTFPTADPLLSSKSVASFSRKGLSFQLSATGPTNYLAGLLIADCSV
jgi:hypothetical protein